MEVLNGINPGLTDWENSELKNGHFVNRFAILFNGIKNLNEIILDTSCWGTTQQKREAIKLDYDQFIFCDTDILFHEHMLRYQLDASYQMEGTYIISPSLAKWWDSSWDELCHSDYKDKPYGYAMDSKEVAELTKSQPISVINARQIRNIKFIYESVEGGFVRQQNSFHDLISLKHINLFGDFF